MIRRTRKILGLMLDEKAIRVAEVRTNAHGAVLTAAGEFSFAEGLSLEDPARLGEALADFFKTHEFTSRKVVIGIPAKWLLTSERVLPSANGEALLSMIRLEAERCFAASGDRLIVDATVGPASSEGIRVLLAAASRERLACAKTLVEAAGLTTLAVTSTTLQLAIAVRRNVPAGFLLTVLPEYAELATLSETGPAALRHIPLSDGKSPTEQTRDLSLALAQASSTVRSPDARQAVPLAVWEAVADPRSAEALSQDLAVKVDAVIGLRNLNLGGTGAALKNLDGRFGGAVALALAGGTARRELSVDFAAPRLEKHKRPMRFRPLAWAAAVALTFAAACIIFLLDWRTQRRELADLQQNLRDMKPDIEAAQSVVEQVRMARGWTDRKPSFLKPLRSLTMAFPWEERIWVTNMAIRQDMKCLVSGKSAGQQSVLTLVDRIREDPSFDQVTVLHVRDAGGSSSDVSFSITFNFVGEE